MAEATLILLAGGRSTRYGKPKQLEAVGPRGEAIMDLSLRDAFACGCDDAIIVLRPEHETAFADRFRNDERVSIVVQQEAEGTAHAAMLGIDGRTTTVVLANADDHYGKPSIALALQHALNGDAEAHALVAFTLANTLSASGGVNRAICKVDANSELLSIHEWLGLRADPLGNIRDTTDGLWDGNELVSMNLWVLRPRIFSLFRELFNARSREPGPEFGLPAVVDAALARGHRFRVLPTKSAWCGLTYPADAELVRRMLAERS